MFVLSPRPSLLSPFLLRSHMSAKQLGPYLIGRQLGRGGMGTVYAGLHQKTKEVAAVKVLSSAMSCEEGFRERFEAEIETLRKLKHENIVRLYGYGEEEGVLFYSMELVEGSSLEGDLRDGRKFTWPEVKEIGVRLCSALKHAHDRGVIHRDIKPANLLISKANVIKLSDFGIAKLFGATGMTSAGGVLGTAEYMAPEQADGRPVGHRADLYSLGAVLYTLLAGRPPFVAQSIPELLQMQRFAEPEPLRRYTVDVPREVEDIVLQLLEKDPERRLSNATVLARRLEATAHGLARREHRGSAGETVADTGFDISEGGPPADPAKSSNLGETRIATHPPGHGSATPADDDEAKPPEDSSPVEEVEDQEFEVEITKNTTRFTTVGEEEEDTHRDLYGESRKTWVSAQTCLLVAGLLGVGLGIYYFMQPPSADTLFGRIEERIADEGSDGVLSSENDIRSFLRHHPRDPRTRAMEDYLEEIELLRLEKTLARRASRKSAVGLSLVETAYLNAMQISKSDPIGAAEKLAALLDLYEGGDHVETRKEKLCVTLASRQLARLRGITRSYVQRNRRLLGAKIQRANKLEPMEPDLARSIRLAVIRLYSDKPWATEVVQLARQAVFRQDALLLTGLLYPWTSPLLTQTIPPVEHRLLDQPTQVESRAPTSHR